MEFGHPQAALAVVGLLLLLNFVADRRAARSRKRLSQTGGLADEWRRRYQLGSPPRDGTPDPRDSRSDTDR